MLVLDELKKSDPQLRLVAGMLAAGLFILLAGLWWVQVVSVREYQGISTRNRIAPSGCRRCAGKSWIARAVCWPKTVRATT